MKPDQRQASAIGHKVLTGFVLLLLLVGVVACGGGAAANAEDVDLDKTVSSQGWDITITAVPEKATVVGEGGFTSQAKGKYVIVFLQAVNNEPDYRLFPATLLQVVDGEDNSYDPTGSTVQFNLARTRPGVNLLLDSPMKGNETRDVVLIYDVPSDASDLKLQLEGAEEPLRLGL
jgi:hypothetical protein